MALTLHDPLPFAFSYSVLIFLYISEQEYNEKWARQQGCVWPGKAKIAMGFAIICLYLLLSFAISSYSVAVGDYSWI